MACANGDPAQIERATVCASDFASATPAQNANCTMCKASISALTSLFLSLDECRMYQRRVELEAFSSASAQSNP
jgi:hypothetical protein